MHRSQVAVGELRRQSWRRDEIQHECRNLWRPRHRRIGSSISTGLREEDRIVGRVPVDGGRHGRPPAEHARVADLVGGHRLLFEVRVSDRAEREHERRKRRGDGAQIGLVQEATSRLLLMKDGARKARLNDSRTV